jgi:hypothetical protein
LAAGVILLGVLPLAPLADVPAEAVPGVILRMEERVGADLTPEQRDKFWASTNVLLGLRFEEEEAERLLEGITVALEESSVIRGAIARGSLQTARRMLISIGQKLLGPIDSESMRVLDTISDPTEIETLGERTPEVSSWHELLGLPAPPPSAPRRPRRRRGS